MIDPRSLEDVMLTNLVIGNRFWRIATGDWEAHAELQRMVEEKVRAAHDGYWAVTKALFDIGVDLALQPSRPESWTAPAEIFVDPGRATLRDNARRLAGYSG